MPDNTPNSPPPANATEHNDEVARKLVEQDQTLKPSTPEQLKSTDDALDALAKTRSEAKEKRGDTPPGAEGAAPKVEEKDGEPKPPTSPKAASEPKPNAPPAPVEDPNKKKADEIFKDSPSLPAGASPKSAEAFAAVKIKAAQDISALQSQLEEANKKLTEFEAKLKNPVPEEVTKELVELRNWRAKLDVEADPKFKQFDSEVERTREFVYAQLRQSPMVTDATIEAIKKHGGPENVNIDKLFESIKDPVLRRNVEGAILSIEQTKFNKTEAMKTAKSNIEAYVGERQKEWEGAAQQHAKQTEEKLKEYTSRLEWMKPITPEAGADENAKKTADAHNKFVDETQKSLKAALQDDSPDMRAIMITATAQLLYTQRVHEALRTEHESVKKQLAEVTEKLEKIKSASTSRLRESAAPAASTPPTKPVDQFNTHTGDALDIIAKQVLDEKARATR